MRIGHTYHMMKKFLCCGLIGWCIEILFTSFDSFRRRDLRLIGQTSIWMFPIYGMSILILPLSRLCRKQSALCRGIIYMFSIFTVEYVSGRLLRSRKLCPWDYSRSKYNINGVIRLDYAIWWFLTGLLYEKILTKWNHPYRPHQ